LAQTQVHVDLGDPAARCRCGLVAQLIPRRPKRSR